MTNSSKSMKPAITNTLCPNEVINDIVKFFTRHQELQVDLKTIRLLAEPYSGRVRSIQLPKDYQNRWAERCGRIPGLALQPLSKVNFKPERKLTREIVENFGFTATGPQ